MIESRPHVPAVALLLLCLVGCGDEPPRPAAPQTSLLINVPACGGAIEGPWSDDVHYLRGRLVTHLHQVRRRKLVVVYLELEERSDSAMDIELPADREVQIEVLDENHAPMPSLGYIWSGPVRSPRVFTVPQDGRIRFPLSGSSCAGGGENLIICFTYGMWTIEPDDPRPYYVRGVMRVEPPSSDPRRRRKRTPGRRRWSGEMLLPPTRVDTELR